MTEYEIREIGGRWHVYADKLSIGIRDDEIAAVKLMNDDSAAQALVGKRRYLRPARDKD